MPVYPISSKENSRRLRAAVHRVFLEVWDPIRISDELNAQVNTPPNWVAWSSYSCRLRPTSKLSDISANVSRTWKWMVRAVPLTM